MSEIQFLPIYDETLQQVLQGSIKQWHSEVASLLPTLPAKINIEFDNDYLVPDSGTGGAAWSLDSLKLAYDPSFDASQEELLTELKATYYHEGYHLARGFSFETTPADLPALTMAIEEGAATRFETVHTGSNPGYAHYEDKATMLAWLEEVKGLPDGFDYDWRRWKFFDPETGRKWILYKVGVFIVDEALKNDTDLTIESMATLSAKQILERARL